MTGASIDGAGPALGAFLRRAQCIAEEGIIWQGGGRFPTSRFLCRAYACDEPPPLDLVTSVRCIVRRGDDVLVVARTAEDHDECHIMAGGRREPGEPIEQTVRREVLEETGWTVGELRPLGAIVFRHVLPRPPDYPFPYPVFAQIVFTADAVAHHAEAMQPDELDGEAIFVPVERANEMRISAWQRAFLALTVTNRDGRS